MKCVRIYVLPGRNYYESHSCPRMCVLRNSTFLEFDKWVYVKSEKKINKLSVSIRAPVRVIILNFAARLSFAAFFNASGSQRGE